MKSVVELSRAFGSKIIIIMVQEWRWREMSKTGEKDRKKILQDKTFTFHKEYRKKSCKTKIDLFAFVYKLLNSQSLESSSFMSNCKRIKRENDLNSHVV